MEEQHTPHQDTNTTSKSDEQSLIQKLLQEKQANKKKSRKSDFLKQGQRQSLSATEVAAMRYKFLTILLIVLATVLWTSFVHPALNDYVDNRQQLTDANVIAAEAYNNTVHAQKLYDFGQAIADE
jgi:hypothetical protein